MYSKTKIITLNMCISAAYFWRQTPSWYHRLRCQGIRPGQRGSWRLSVVADWPSWQEHVDASGYPSTDWVAFSASSILAASPPADHVRPRRAGLWRRRRPAAHRLRRLRRVRAPTDRQASGCRSPEHRRPRRRAVKAVPRGGREDQPRSPPSRPPSTSPPAVSRHRRQHQTGDRDAPSLLTGDVTLTARHPYDFELWDRVLPGSQSSARLWHENWRAVDSYRSSVV